VSKSSQNTDSVARLSEDDRALLTHSFYGELRKLAGARMATERAPQTLQATALVHEAWLRMGADHQPDWVNRAQLYVSAAKVMRRILIDRARKRQAVRHGGGQHRVDMDAVNWERVDAGQAASNDQSLLLVNEALKKLQMEDRNTANLVELHYFGGMTISELANTLGLSRRTAERRLAFARAWLGRELENAENGDE
jgi:RNA polymerase sigma factor (TIGR02999 family)